MDSQALINKLNSKQIKNNVADVRVGDTVRVHYKIREGNKERVQIFEGLVIGTKSGTSLQGSFVVRKVVTGVGVERTFPLHSPWIIKIERTKTGKVRRAKLGFVRRYAMSSRFKLKDKGVAGTVWEEVAKQQEEIAEAAEETPQAEEVAEASVSEENAVDEQLQQDAGESGGDASEPVSSEEEADDTESKPSN
jgi:large subunit ribosomal protein L19